MRATIREVARRAGVSPMTVSRVLSERGNLVAPETRDAILKAVRELNYIPIRTAVQNRKVETRVIGMISHFQDITTHFVGKNLFAGIHDGARRHGYDLLAILRSRPEWAQGRQEAMLLDKRTDGHIFTDNALSSLLKTLVTHEIPVVVCNNSSVPSGVAFATMDEGQSVQLALEHLLAKGHRRIGYIAGANRHSQARARRKAFEERVEQLQIPTKPDWIATGDWQETPKDVEAARAILKTDVTAVLCGNDPQALTLWDEATALGRRVPHDLSIVGVDDTPEAAERGLTSIRNPFAKIGSAAVDAMIDLISGKTAQESSRVVPVDLIQRKSVAEMRGS